MATGKRGLAWPSSNTESVTPFVQEQSKVTWLYNWSPDALKDSPLEFVPMQWNDVNADKLLEKAKAANSKAILSFNEPERSDQANMTVEAAAGAWSKHIEPLRKAGIRCGSPGISSTEDGVQWLQKFVAAIRAEGGDIDFYSLHWFGPSLGPFYDYIWSTHARLGTDKPVWITSFAPTNWDASAPLGKDEVETFLRESCKYLDTLDWVERYAFFGAMKDPGGVGKWVAMLDSEGHLTDAGKIYCDYPTSP